MNQDVFIESKPLREKIADIIRTDIIRGVYRNGERLVEPKLAKTLGISRTPIREALRQLEGEGFIEIVPRRGAVVKELTIKDIDDLYAIKANLEGLAARQATVNLTDDQIEILISINKKFRDYSEKNPGVPDEHHKDNIDFHNVFIAASGNEKLVDILDGMSKNFQRLKSMLMSDAGRAANAVKEHKKIIDAFISRDPDLAEKTVREHINSGWEYLKQRINNR
ncbi:GntR family transcriptional regulator [Seleniivibrio woodruffii]|uniref:GntR family transcriptional regulator n=1 Tax=Seleniivibrio woodruffii TaxID=1078050 RepID=A0A4R1K876_9BACT|nr:GntR family transcriptional regulator [Seleniivibrio woodruffii]TCK60508.1 GntR family transcriptional regulator [Seleniivibrio woodruffii]TVZ36136.1 GntR family transcriptional regulator [Seleniivibrio woodruffii]